MFFNNIFASSLSSTTFILTGLAGSTALAYSIYVIIEFYFYRLKFKSIPGPPTPPGLAGFIFGNLKEIADADKNGISLPDLLNNWLSKYGNTIKYQLFTKMVVISIEPIAVKDVLITKNFPKYPLIYSLVGFPFRGRFLGNGLVSEQNHEKWKRDRALFNPGFHRQKLLGYMDEFNLKGDILIEKLRELADGKTFIRLHNEISHAALDVIASVAFGMNVDSINDPNNRLNYYVSESFKGLNVLILDPLLIVIYI